MSNKASFREKACATKVKRVKVGVPSVEELKELGHLPLPLLKVIRAGCFQCSNTALSIELCPMKKSCVFWPYRDGKNPFKKRRRASVAQLASLNVGRKKRLANIPAVKGTMPLSAAGSGALLAGRKDL